MFRIKLDAAKVACVRRPVNSDVGRLHNMHCPYCDEEIRDAAIVCRYCKRDLALPQLNSRLTKLEESVAKLQLRVGSMQIPETPTQKSSIVQTWIPLVIGTAFAIVAAVVAYRRPSQLTAVLAFLAPLPLAVYLAFNQTYRRISKYLWVGILQGTAMSLVSFGDAIIANKPLGKNIMFDVSIVSLYGLLYVAIASFRMHFTRSEMAAPRFSFSERFGTPVITGVLSIIGIVVNVILTYLLRNR